jgi:deazaflavin-dependent oxidoreductase (nitroreductase family)
MLTGVFMNIPPPHPNVIQRLNHNVSTSRVGAKLFSLTFHHIDRPILQASKGRYALSAWLTGLPIVVLTTTGAKSGQARAIPLIAIPDGDRAILIASNWGGPHYPAWYHNLRVHPRATITFGGETTTYVAREVVGKEYDAYWQRATDLYKGYAAYKTRTGGRPIPILVLETDKTV